MSHSLLHSVLTQLAEPFTGEMIFDALSDVVFFLKNDQGQYVLVNQTLAMRCGMSDKQSLLGKTAADVLPAPLGHNCLEQDRRVITSGVPLLNELELHLYPSGDEGWCLTNKLPLRGVGEKCVGLVGFSRDLHAPTEDYRDVAEALRKVQTRLEQPMTVDDVAKLAGLSTFQLDHRIREVFHVSASQLMLKFRLDRATQRLRDTTLPIAHIALEIGYADQSSFTRQFHRTIGLTPAEYRKRYQA